MVPGVPNLSAIVRWKAKCLTVSRNLMAKSDAGPEPITAHHLDQILATARDAGLSKREQGVFLVTLVEADMVRKGWAKKIPADQRLSIAAAIAMLLLDSAPS